MCTRSVLAAFLIASCGSCVSDITRETTRMGLVYASRDLVCFSPVPPRVVSPPTYPSVYGTDGCPSECTYPVSGSTLVVSALKTYIEDVCLSGVPHCDVLITGTTLQLEPECPCELPLFIVRNDLPGKPAKAVTLSASAAHDFATPIFTVIP